VKTKIRVYRVLESLCRYAAERFDYAAEVFSLCSHCGRNRYTSMPCAFTQQTSLKK
jgi:hypothetical protein